VCVTFSRRGLINNLGRVVVVVVVIVCVCVTPSPRECLLNNL
jgi:hypothetical protein